MSRPLPLPGAALGFDAPAAGDEAMAIRRDCAQAARGLGRGAALLLCWPLLAVPAAMAMLQASLALRALGLLGVLAACFSFYCGVRVLFDARVFARWSQAADPRAAMAAFDLRIGRSTLPPRGLPERVAGARRWLRRMSGGLLLQGGTLAAIVLALGGRGAPT